MNSKHGSLLKQAILSRHLHGIGITGASIHQIWLRVFLNVKHYVAVSFTVGENNISHLVLNILYTDVWQTRD